MKNHSSNALRCVLSIIFVVVIVSSLKSQVYKFRSTHLCFGMSGDNCDWVETNDVLISFDSNKKRITIFASKENYHDIIQTYPVEIDEDGIKTVAYLCVDDTNQKNTVALNYFTDMKTVIIGVYYSNYYIAYKTLILNY